MPHVCIPEGHFAFHGDLENGDYEVALAVIWSWQESLWVLATCSV